MGYRIISAHRVYISTDLGGDPDDIQSLYRLIHFSDILDVEGIGSCTGPGSTNSAGLIGEWIRRVDVDFLRAKGHTGLMAEADLLSVVRQGATKPGAPGPGQATPASRHITECARSGAGGPLRVLVWGSLTDLAQALHDDPEIAPLIRINCIGSSNTEHDPASRDWVYAFMRDRFPELWFIENGVLPKGSHETFRGVYLGGDQEGGWSNTAFIENHIRGRGSDHEGLFAEPCGDAFPVAGWPEGTLKEGDSPTMLHLLSPALGGPGDPDDPTRPNWGGQYHRPEPESLPNYFTDLPADPETCQATISRWRRDFLGSWLQRWRWYDA